MTTNLCELFVYLYCLFLFLLHFLFGRWMRYKHVVAVVDATPCLHVYRRNLQLGCWFCRLLHGKYTSPISYHADCLRYRLIRCGLLRWSHYTAWNLVRPCFQKLPKTFVSNNIAFGVKIISFNNATTTTTHTQYLQRLLQWRQRQWRRGCLICPTRSLVVQWHRIGSGFILRSRGNNKHIRNAFHRTGAGRCTRPRILLAKSHSLSGKFFSSQNNSNNMNTIYQTHFQTFPHTHTHTHSHTYV